MSAVEVIESVPPVCLWVCFRCVLSQYDMWGGRGLVTEAFQFGKRTEIYDMGGELMLGHFHVKNLAFSVYSSGTLTCADLGPVLMVDLVWVLSATFSCCLELIISKTYRLFHDLDILADCNS